MSRLEQVRTIAARLELLDKQGRLIPLDSLAIVDLVVELETELKIRIPTSHMRVDSFRDVETVAKMVDDILGARAG
jgi:acyl carrier protein